MVGGGGGITREKWGRGLCRREGGVRTKDTRGKTRGVTEIPQV